MELTLSDLVTEYVQYEQNTEFKSDIESLLAGHDYAELSKRFIPRISFGTAGLRARMEGGYARMNDLVITQTTNGFAKYLLAQEPNVKTMGVVVGHDARYNSERFAQVTASVFADHGIKVYWFGTPVHTPLVPFTVRTCRAAAGVMITASHNPPNDNGYKVYWSNGCQIIPPHDAGISGAILSDLKPRSPRVLNFDEPSALLEHVFPSMLEQYCQSISQLARFSDPADIPDFVHTSLHGVGARFIDAALRQCTSASSSNPPSKIIHVPSQKEPNPAFPTVKFPNPEEAGALDAAIETANSHPDNVSLILANDPDADRFCAAERLPDGRWHQFTGNQTGILLASYILTLPANHPLAISPRSITALLNTTVSTGMLRAMAAHEGSEYVETLTGFKWLGNVAQTLERERGWRVPFAFEEALGYMFPSVVYDKDGIAAAMVFLAAIASWRRQNRSVMQQWETLCENYGYFVDANTYLITPSGAVTQQVFGDLRRDTAEAGLKYPASVGGRRITWWRDLTVGYDSATADGVPVLPVDAGSQMISADLESDDGIRTRFTVRGSGTEPKIKLYIESRAASESVARAESLAVQSALVQEWFTPAKYGLKQAGK